MSITVLSSLIYIYSSSTCQCIGNKVVVQHCLCVFINGNHCPLNVRWNVRWWTCLNRWIPSDAQRRSSVDLKCFPCKDWHSCENTAVHLSKYSNKILLFGLFSIILWINLLLTFVLIIEFYGARKWLGRASITCFMSVEDFTNSPKCQPYFENFYDTETHKILPQFVRHSVNTTWL